MTSKVEPKNAHSEKKPASNAAAKDILDSTS